MPAHYPASLPHDRRGTGVLTNLQCCGAKEYHGISYNSWSVESMMDFLRESIRPNNWSPYFSTLFITDRLTGRDTTRRSTKLQQLQNYVRRHKLGTVRIAPPNVNPNSGNSLFPAVYCVDTQALSRHLRDTDPSVTRNSPRWRAVV
jgi:hypothetical protein